MRKLITYRELKEKKGIRWSRRHLVRLEAAGKFPKRVVMGANAIAWDEAEVDDTVAGYFTARDDGACILRPRARASARSARRSP